MKKIIFIFFIPLLVEAKFSSLSHKKIEQSQLIAMALKIQNMNIHAPCGAWTQAHRGPLEDHIYLTDKILTAVKSEKDYKKIAGKLDIPMNDYTSEEEFNQKLDSKIKSVSEDILSDCPSATDILLKNIDKYNLKNISSSEMCETVKKLVNETCREHKEQNIKYTPPSKKDSNSSASKQ